MEDIELLAGVWTERAVRGARVPATFYCVVVEQLRRSAASDRHWYEAKDRPNAFTMRTYPTILYHIIFYPTMIYCTQLYPTVYMTTVIADQLLQIRKATVARLLCDVGDGVTSIQPKAFLLSGLG